jgi:hypothetical protein
MSEAGMDLSPKQYVQENEEVLANIIKHSSDDFVRAIGVPDILEYGDDPTREKYENARNA